MRNIQRKVNGRVVAGVCGGLGEAWGVDPLLLRILFVVLAVINGIGVALYLLAWLLLPAEHTAGRAFSEETIRQSAAEIGQRTREGVVRARTALGHGPHASAWDPDTRHSDAALVSGLVISGLGLLILLHKVGALAWLTLGKLLPLGMIAVGALILVNNLKRA